MTLHNLLPFCGPNIISDGLTNGLFIHYYRVINRCQVWCHDIYTESFIVARYGDMTFIESHSSLPGMVTWHLYRVIHCCQVWWHDIYTESSIVARYGDMTFVPSHSLLPDTVTWHLYRVLLCWQVRWRVQWPGHPSVQSVPGLHLPALPLQPLQLPPG